MLSNELSEELVISLNRDFALSSEQLPVHSDVRYIKEKLTKVILHLLSHDLNRLLSIFYRIDLEEKKVNFILTFSKPDKIASELSELVYERELEKVKTRLRYIAFFKDNDSQ